MLRTPAILPTEDERGTFALPSSRDTRDPQAIRNRAVFQTRWNPDLDQRRLGIAPTAQVQIASSMEVSQSVSVAILETLRIAHMRPYIAEFCQLFFESRVITTTRMTTRRMMITPPICAPWG